MAANTTSNPTMKRSMTDQTKTAEGRRLQESRDQLDEGLNVVKKGVAWKKWGPYLSERQWSTVREDYSPSGDAWGYFPHDQARSRAYRWGEDGLGGICDDNGRLCFALALWNGVDPILKERLFGLTNTEGNHGEDVKEYYFYLDSTPTHSYMKYLYKYPQREYPYLDLVQTNRRRSRYEFEYELLDTGIFADDRYFDVFVEYAKESPEELAVKISIANRGKQEATLHLLPTLWFRNTWTGPNPEAKPSLREALAPGMKMKAVHASHAKLGDRYLYCQGDVPLLFTENETNTQMIFGVPNSSPFVKDGINNHVVLGAANVVNPGHFGTKCSAHYQLSFAPGETKAVHLRLSERAPENAGSGSVDLARSVEQTVSLRKAECDEFYTAITPPVVGQEEAAVMRQALAGMLWSKQHYQYDLTTWLKEHGVTDGGSSVRNQHWKHMLNDDVISMPDKWEYPWYAAWDLAYHTIALGLVDSDFAKQQLDLMLRGVYMHPSGQLPAYEWNFSDVNPPVHAWATMFLYYTEIEMRGKGDIEFLKQAFNKLLVNFTWWVNREDPEGHNVFEGGFLGLDNIGVFDRSAPVPGGGRLDQADGTAWMALFSQNMFEIAVQLALADPAYESMALTFLERFLAIASSMDQMGAHKEGMWDEEDGFFYDLLHFPNGNAMRLKVRSYVGLLPLCATTVIPAEAAQSFPWLVEGAREFLERHPNLTAKIAKLEPGLEGRYLFSILNQDKLRRVLARMLDEKEFLSPYGIRSVSRYHLDHPYMFNLDGQDYRVDYMPAESTTGMFGGNSNWRGPVWFPVNALIIRALTAAYGYYGDEFKVECPTGSGRQMTLFQVAKELGDRLTRIFTRDANGRRAVYGGTEKFQSDPYWRDYILFHEYFHGDNGAGLGASHQTGWTGLVARLIHLFGTVQAEDVLSGSQIARSFRQGPVRQKAA